MKEKIEFINTYGEKLIGTIHLTESPSERGIVFGHCFTCSRHTTVLRRVCTDLAENGFMALRFDFSGNGQSEGAFSASTFSRQIDEMKTAAQYLSSRGARWIGMCGHSMGAVVSFLTANQMTSIKAVCCMGGRFSDMHASRFLSPAQKDELKTSGRVIFISRGRTLIMTRDFLKDADRFDLLEVLRQCTTPALVIHGDRDDVVPVHEAHLAGEANPDWVETAIIKGADHMFSHPEHLREVSERVVEWFKKKER